MELIVLAKSSSWGDLTSTWLRTSIIDAVMNVIEVLSSCDKAHESTVSSQTVCLLFVG